MKVVFVGYRDWAIDILRILQYDKWADWQIQGVCDTTGVKQLKPDVILLCGWSQIVDKDFLDIAPCISLHPSPLPKYRGGSPIQNQIIAGEKEGAVTLYLVTEGIDAGPIVAQKGFSLEGELDDIFQRIITIGAGLTIQVLNNFTSKELSLLPQLESMATFCKRRKPEESEITFEELCNNSAEYIYNKIRALQDPYPNAFITCGDGKKIYLTKGHL